MCGHCCHGAGGIILTRKDVLRLAEHLGVCVAEFLKAYAETAQGRVRLKTGEDEYCIFYAEGCGVHPGRPDVCRAWPFFRGNLMDESSWEMIQEYCPGVNPEVGHAEFRRQGFLHLEELGAGELGEDAPAALKPPGK
jgi:hypothetical protein